MGRRRIGSYHTTRSRPRSTALHSVSLCTLYVLISRVRTSNSLRLLHHDRNGPVADGLAALGSLKHDEKLVAWERGYDANGVWSDQLALQALKRVRHDRRASQQVRADAKKATKEAEARATRGSGAKRCGSETVME